jgi:hypothetical protein
MKDEFKNIDNFIKKNLEVESTSPDFSDKIFSQIKIAETLKEKELFSLLQKYAKEEPSSDFSSMVMQQILQTNRLTHQPVITKKVWFIIITIFVVIIRFIFSNAEFSKKEPGALFSYMLQIKNLYNFEEPVILFSPLFAWSLLALSSLLGLDFVIRNKSISFFE